MPPMWPPQPGTQQMQQHLDLLVDDHEDDDEIVRVHRDTAGHPFFLFIVK